MNYLLLLKLLRYVVRNHKTNYIIYNCFFLNGFYFCKPCWIFICLGEWHEPMDYLHPIVSDLRPGTNVYPKEYALSYLFMPFHLLWSMGPPNILILNIWQEKTKTQKLSLPNVSTMQSLTKERAQFSLR